MRNFFVDPANLDESFAVLIGQEARHIDSVLRLGRGDRINLFDGTGMIYEVIIEEAVKTRIKTRILKTRPARLDGPRTYLGQGLLKGKKMDFIVRKATELGVNGLMPFVSSHCTVRRVPETRETRWHRISLESCKQCGRPYPLKCMPVTDFNALISASEDYQMKIIFWEKENIRTLEKVFSDNSCIKSVIFLVGPEGGFSKQEIEMAASTGYEVVSLGKLILRAETASFAAMAILQYITGNLGSAQV